MRQPSLLVILIVIVAGLGGFILHKKLSDPVVFIYVKNNSFDLPQIDMHVTLDTLVVADTLFIESEEPSLGNVYEVASTIGTHVLNVSSLSMNLAATDTFDTASDKYVLVDFFYKQKGTHRYESARQQFDRLTRRDPEAVIKSDTLYIEPNIRIRITDEKPEAMAE